MKKYRFREKSPYQDKDANRVGKFLENYFPDQNPDPDKVVELARNKGSPLHEFFDWNDKTAADKYRRKQAGDLIAALYVELDDGKRIRAYESVFIKEIDNNSYLSTAIIG